MIMFKNLLGIKRKLPVEITNENIYSEKRQIYTLQMKL